MASEYKPNFGVVTITNATVLDDDGYAGVTVNLNSAAGRLVTLPPATGTGATYTVVIGTTLTSGNHIIRVAPGTNVIQGVLLVVTDIGGVTFPTAVDSDTITMNGTTTGGLRGSRVELMDLAAGVWSVSGALISTGDEATPFSATVT